MTALFHFISLFFLLTLLSYLLSLALTQHMQNFETVCHKILQYPHKQFTNIRVSVFFALLLPFFLLVSLRAEQAFSLIFSMLFILFLVYISVLDFRQEIIPDKLLIKFLFLILFAFPLSGHSLLDSLLGALGGFFSLFFLSLLTRGAIGGGDIKLLFVLGLWTGTEQLPVLLMGGFVAGGLAALLLVLTKKKTRTESFAYGPWFCLMAALLLILQ